MITIREDVICPASCGSCCIDCENLTKLVMRGEGSMKFNDSSNENYPALTIRIARNIKDIYSPKFAVNIPKMLQEESNLIANKKLSGENICTVSIRNDSDETTTVWDRPKRRFVSTNRTEGFVKLRLSPREMKD